jgi:hypothetical protein
LEIADLWIGVELCTSAEPINSKKPGLSRAFARGAEILMRHMQEHVAAAQQDHGNPNP